MSYPFDQIVIIYNPNSTGDSEKNAKTLALALKDRLPNTDIDVKATEHAGHAEEIGAELARDDRKKLALSSSGDGGYNELINGVLSIGSVTTVVAVMPSGNANDHHHATADSDLVDRITEGKLAKLDALKLTGRSNSKTFVRYAHSYIGAGVTPYIATQLNKTDLNPLNEKWLIVKHLLRFSYVELSIGDNADTYKYSSVLFANIGRMSKHIELSDSADFSDGQMEVYLHRRQSIAGLAVTFLKGIFSGLKPQQRISSTIINTKDPLDLQCDGELVRLDAGSAATIEVSPGAITTLAP